MKYQIVINDASGETRVQKEAVSGDVIRVEAGDTILVLDENGAPATGTKMLPDGSDLIIEFPGENIAVTLDEYFSSGGEGAPIHLNLAPGYDSATLYQWLANRGAPTQELQPATGEGGGEFNGAVGDLPEGGDFTLMRLSDLGYANFEQSFGAFGDDLSREISGDLTPPPEGFGGSNSNSEPTDSDSQANSNDDDDEQSADGGESVSTISTPSIPLPNQAPVAVNDVASTSEDSAVIIDLLGNDYDPDGDPISIVSAQAGNGSVVVHSNGTVTYTANPNFNGTDTIIYRITDPSGATDTASATVNVAPVNDPPVAVDDVATTDEDTPILGLDVLANDVDIDGDPLTVTSATAPNGTVTINPDGTLNYTPDLNYNGPDTITYTISDPSGATSTATVAVTVNSVNDAPVAADDANALAEDDVAAATGNVLGNDTDVDGDPLAVSEVDGVAGDVGAGVVGTYGTITINADGTYSYALDNGNPTVQALAVGETLTETFNYTADDGAGASDSATLTLTINGTNDAPESNPIGGTPGVDPGVYDDADSIDEDDATPATGNVLANDRDPDTSDTLSVSEVNGVAGNVGAAVTGSYGSVTIAADGTYSYALDNGNATVQGLGVGQSITDTFTYTADDGNGGSASATLTITIDGTNDAPAAADDVYTGTEDVAFTSVLGVDDVLQNDSDIDGDTLTVNTTPVSGPSNGILVLNADGTFTYTPNANFNGPDSFVYEVSDGNGGTAQATATINVAAVNDAPVAVDDVAATNEDTPILGLDILGNDSDVDGDPLTFVAVPTAPNGTVVVNFDGTINYTPDPNFNGVDTITYTIQDPSGATDTATVTVTVDPVNDAPVATDNTYAGTEDVTVNGNLITEDTGDGVDNDIEGSPLSVTQFTVGAATYAAGTTVNFAEGDLTINGDGSFSFVPAADYNGPVPVATYTLSDGSLTDTATLGISLAAVNDAPVATNDVYAGTEDVTVSGNVITDNTGAGVDSDVDLDALNVTQFVIGATTYAAGTTVNLAEGDFTINGDGSFTFVPVANYNGPVPTATYTLSDGVLTDTATLGVNLAAVNDAPVATDDVYTGTEDVTLNGNVITDNTGAGVDSDVDLDALNVTQFTIGASTYAAGTTVNLAEGDLTINGDGSFSFVPAADYNGAVPNAVYTLSDGSLTDTATLGISLAAVNDAPVATNDVYAGTEDVTVSGNVITDDAGAGVDSDVDLDALSVTQFVIGATTYAAGTTVNLAEGDFTVNGDGSFTFVPVANYNGPVPTATYTLSDGVLTDTATLGISLAAVNDPPVATDNTYSGTEDVTVNGNVITDNTGAGVDSDIEGSPLSVTQFAIGATTYVAGTTANLAEGDLTINGDGSFSFVPSANYNGAIPAATYTLSDGALTDTATLGINLAAADDPPVATDDVYAGTEDVTVSGNVITDNTGAGVDSDIEGSPLSVSQFTVGAATYAAGTTVNLAEGDLTINGDGSFTFVPVANYNGPVPAATYTLSDGALTDTATLGISLAAVNDGPVATDNTYVGSEDTTLNGNIITDNTGAGVDSDLEGDPLSITQFTIGAATYAAGTTVNLAEGDLTINGDGTFSFVPVANYNGPVPAVTYTLSDGLLTDTAALGISLAAVNDPPVATNDVYAGTEDVTVNGNVITDNTGAGVDSDLEGDPLSVTQFVVGAGTYTAGDTANLAEGDLTINGDGSFSFVPASNYNGPVPAATYTLSDGSLTDTATLGISLASVNDAPVATNDVYATNEDTTLNANVITDNAGSGIDSDPDGDGLTVTQFVVGASTYAAGATAVLAEGSLTINGDGSLVFVPADDFNGPVPAATYTLSDGVLTDTAVVNISVDPVADPPVATDNTYVGTEDVVLNGNVITDDAGAGVDSDVEGDPLSVTQFVVGASTYAAGATANLAEGDLTINGDGTFTFSPATDYNGPVPAATYTLSDGALTDTAALNISLDPVNDAPVANNDQLSATLIETQTINLVDNDTDVDGPALDIATIDLDPGTVGIQDTLTVAGEGEWQTDGLGNVVFTPEVGIDTQPSAINYTIQDTSGAISNIASIQLEFVTVDIWFGNDNSGSVDPTEFTQSRDLISGTADLIDFGNSIGANAALFSWSDTGQQTVNFPLTNDKAQFVDDSANNYTQSFSGGTDIGDAITYGAALIGNPANGARAGVPQVLVILTDAFDYQITGDASLAADAAAAKAAGITLVIVAIDAATVNPVALALLADAASTDDNGDPLLLSAATYADIDAADMQALIDTIALEASQLPPVVIDLDGDGVEFSGIEDGILFDADDDGVQEQVAWAGQDDAVLVYDHNANGQVDDRSEIAFADYSSTPGATDLEGLRHFDTDGDLMLTADDAEFESFHLWQDADGDGLVGAGEFRSLSDAGVESIGLVNDGQSYSAANGDVLVHGESEVQFADGSTTAAADASFGYVEANSLVEPAGSDAPLEIVSNSGTLVNLDEAPPVAEPIIQPDAVEIESVESTPPPIPGDDGQAAAAAAAM